MGDQLGQVMLINRGLHGVEVTGDLVNDKWVDGKGGQSDWSGSKKTGEEASELGVPDVFKEVFCRKQPRWRGHC